MLHPNLATGLLVLLSLGHTGLHAQSKHVLIIGLDGVRTDALKLAHTPNIDSLVATGAVTWDAFAGGAFDPSDPTHQATSSGPGWSSMLTGVWVDKHGVSDNSFGGNDLANYPHFFAHVKAAIPSHYLSSIVHWDPINDNCLPGISRYVGHFGFLAERCCGSAAGREADSPRQCRVIKCRGDSASTRRRSP